MSDVSVYPAAPVSTIALDAAAGNNAARLLARPMPRLDGIEDTDAALLAMEREIGELFVCGRT